MDFLLLQKGKIFAKSKKRNPETTAKVVTFEPFELLRVMIIYDTFKPLKVIPILLRVNIR